MPALTGFPVTEIAAADLAAARDQFEKMLAFEIDCWDVHTALAAGQQDFVLLDVRSPEAYQQGHVPATVNLPHRRIVERTLSGFRTRLRKLSDPVCNRRSGAFSRLTSNNNFNISVDPGIQTVTAGGSINYTVTTSIFDGFSGAISLGAERPAHGSDSNLHSAVNQYRWRDLNSDRGHFFVNTRG